MVYIIKKLPDVAFQNPAGFGVVLAYFLKKLSKSVYRSMCAFFKIIINISPCLNQLMK